MRSITEFSKELLVVTLLTLITGCGDMVAPDEESVSQEELVRDISISHELQAVAHFSIPDAYFEGKVLALRSENRLDEVSHQGQHRVHGPLPRAQREKPPFLRRPVQVIPLPRVRDHVSFKCADTASQIAAVMSVSLVRLSGEDAETIETVRTPVHCQQLTIEINRLHVGESYRIEAEIARPDGKLHHRGKSEEFGVVPGKISQVELVMKRVDEKSEGGVEVLVTFEDSVNDDISETIPSTCDTSTFAEATGCIQRRATELEAYLRTRGGLSRYDNIEPYLETIREKNLELQQIQSLDNVSTPQRDNVCQELRTMSSLSGQISAELRLSGEGELERAEPFLGNFTSSLVHTEQLLNCHEWLPRLPPEPQSSTVRCLLSPLPLMSIVNKPMSSRLESCLEGYTSPQRFQEQQEMLQQILKHHMPNQQRLNQLRQLMSSSHSSDIESTPGPSEN